MSQKQNWKAIVERKSAEVYRLPEGWDSRDTVANNLVCSPERVSEILRPAIKSGEVETKSFPVWDRESKRVVRVTAYRPKPRK